MSQASRYLVLFGVLLAFLSQCPTSAQHPTVPYSFNGTTTTVSTVLTFGPFLTATFVVQNWAHRIEGAVARLAAVVSFSLSRPNQFVIRCVQTDLETNEQVYNGSLSGSQFLLVCNRTYNFAFFDDQQQALQQATFGVLNCSDTLLPQEITLQTEPVRTCSERGVRFLNMPVFLNRIGVPVLSTRALPYARVNVTFYTNNTYNSHGLVMIDYDIAVNRTVTQLQQTEAGAVFDQPVGAGAQLLLTQQSSALITSGSTRLVAVNRTTLVSGSFTPASLTTLFTTDLNASRFEITFGVRHACQTRLSTLFSVFRRPNPGVTPEIAGTYVWANMFLDCELTASNPVTAPVYTVQSTTVQSPPFLVTDRLGRVWNATVAGTARAGLWNEFNTHMVTTPSLLAVNVSFPLDSAYFGSSNFNSSAWFVSANLTYQTSGVIRTFPEVQFTDIRGRDSFLSFAVFAPTTLLFRCNERNIVQMQSNTTVPASIGPVIVDVQCGVTTPLVSACSAPVAQTPTPVAEANYTVVIVLSSVFGAVTVILIVAIGITASLKAPTIGRRVGTKLL